MEYRELLESYAREAGLADISQALADGLCTFDFGAISVSFVEHAETHQIVLWSVLAPVPEEGKGELARMMMREMVEEKVPIGTLFSIDADTGNFCLHRCESLILIDLETFKTTVQNFVGTVRDWRTRVADFRPSEAPSAGNAAGAFQFGPLGGDFIRV